MTSVYFFSPDGAGAGSFAALSEMGAEGLRYLDSGKPVADNCFVSVSDSGALAAVCLSDMPVGIDIEKIDCSRDLPRLAERWFSEAEKKYFFETEEPFRFYEIWTRKEAYSKIGGRGLAELVKGADTLSLEGFSFWTERINGYVITLCESSRKEGEGPNEKQV